MYFGRCGTLPSNNIDFGGEGGAGYLVGQLSTWPNGRFSPFLGYFEPFWAKIAPKMTKKLNLQGLHRRETGECTAKISSRVAPHPQIQHGSQTTSSKKFQNYLTFFQAKKCCLAPFSAKFCHMKIEELCYTVCENAKIKSHIEWPALTPFWVISRSKVCCCSEFQVVSFKVRLSGSCLAPRKCTAKWRLYSAHCRLNKTLHPPSCVKWYSPTPLTSDTSIYPIQTFRLWQSSQKTLQKVSFALQKRLSQK